MTRPHVQFLRARVISTRPTEVNSPENILRRRNMRGNSLLMDALLNPLKLTSTIGMTGDERLPSRYPVTDLAAAAIGAFGAALASLCEALGIAAAQDVEIDRRLASLWFGMSVRPEGWELPPDWDPLAGDYETADGWIKIHANAPAHRAAAIRVLEGASNKDAFAASIKRRNADELETAIVAEGGAAAAMRSRVKWRGHPQGRAITSEALIQWEEQSRATKLEWPATADRPLNGLRVLDLTRILAGPVATRALAGLGADVLRIDPPGWDEGIVIPEVTLGKRCARLDLRSIQDREKFESLLHDADVLIHGYRKDALANLGYDKSNRRQLNPDLIEVTLTAYGWTGPWAGRRGFDSLVQMSSGIAHAGMEWARASAPTPLPVQALDHATGWMMAASALRAIESAANSSVTRSAKLSLAATAEVLAAHEQPHADAFNKTPRSQELSPAVEHTPWGAARRLRSPLTLGDIALHWDRAACELGSHQPTWRSVKETRRRAC